VTVEEFFAIANQPENELKKLEVVDGALVEQSTSTFWQSVVAARVASFLVAHDLPRKTGYVTGATAVYITRDQTYRQPDAAYITRSRAGGLDRLAFPVAPDLAVEVVSPDEDIYKKALEYLRAGTRLVWAVYPDDRTVHVMQLDEDGGLRSHAYGVDATLDGGDVLSGFALAVRDVFPD
jgi:Uma2 family endonuclease